MARPRHELALWHTSHTSNGTAISSNQRPAADGQGNVVWSAGTAGGSVSYGSNSNDISSVSAAGAATEVSRVDHVHRGVTSVAHTSNTFYGPLTFTTPGNSVGITSPSSGTLAFTSVGAGAVGQTITTRSHGVHVYDSAVQSIPNNVTSTFNGFD